LIATPVALVTVPDTAEKVALVCPAAIVTEDGTDAAALLLKSVITTPPVGAALAATTVPVDVFPLTTEAGAKLSPEREIVAGFTVICPDPDFVVSSTEVAFTFAVVELAGAV
jgi:hypothetical protein